MSDMTLKQMITIIELSKKIENDHDRTVFTTHMNLIVNARTNDEAIRVHDAMFNTVDFEKWGIPRFLEKEKRKNE